MENANRLVAAAAVFAAFVLAVPLAEATTPTITGAKAISPTQIEVTFSEPVKTTTNSHVGWTASGGDLGSLRILSGTSLSAAKNTVVFTLNGELPDTTPDGITLSYSTTQNCEFWYFAQRNVCQPFGRITDAAGDPLASRANISVSDGIAPTFTASATALNSITVVFSEAVTGTGTVSGTWTLSGADAGTRTVTGSSPTGSTVSLSISPDLTDRSPDLTLAYNPSSGDLADSSGNEPSGLAKVTDRIKPLKPSITTQSVTVTSPSFDVSGTAEEDSEVAVYVGTRAESGAARATGGTWTKTVTLEPGANSITAKATDGAGNESDASEAVSVTYNPTGTVITTVPSTFTSTQQTIEGRAPASSSVSLYRAGMVAALATGAADSAGLWSIQIDLVAGDNAIRAESTKDGVTVTSAPVTFVLDTATHDLAVVSSIRDEEGVFGTLAAPRDVEMFERDGKTYALVASAADSGLQLIDMSDPNEPDPVASVETSGLPFDVEIAEVGQKTFAIVAAHRSGAVDFVDITDLSAISKVRTVRHDSSDPAGNGFLRLEGARSLDYFAVNSKHYVVVASDAGKTTLAPGGFLIMEFNENVGTDGTRTAPNFQHVYSNHQKQTDENGDEVVYSENRGGYGSAIFEPHARFDAGADAFVPVTNREPIGNRAGTWPGTFDVPRGGVSIYTWILSVDKDSNWKNFPSRADNWNSLTDSQGRERTVTDAGWPVPLSAPIDKVETAPSRVLVMNDNDTPADKSDDWLEASFGYGYSKGSIFRSPISERQVPNDGGSALVAVDANGRPFEKRGLDAAGTLFPALEGAGSVDTFAVTKDGSTKTYAAIAAEELDAVQIIDISAPAAPLHVEAVFDGGRDEAGGQFLELDGAAGIEVVTINSKPYAVVASYRDDGFQIIDLSDPGSPLAASSGADRPGRAQGAYSTLDGPTSVHTFEHTVAGGPRTYALFTAGGYEDDGDGGGFQLVDITDPVRPYATGSGRDGERCSTAARYNYLGGANSAATAVIEGRLYSVIAGMDDDGIQTVRMDLSRRGSTLTVVNATADDTGGYSALGAPRSSEIAQINGRTYMFVSSFKEGDALDGARVVGNGGGLQIIDVTNPAAPQPAASLIDTDNTPFDILRGVGDIDVFEVGGRPYAIVTAQDEWAYSPDDGGPASRGGFLILDVSDPHNPRRASGVLAGQPYGGGDTGQSSFKMSGPIGVDTAKIGAKTYAVIASNYQLPAHAPGVSVVDITNPRLPKPVAWIAAGSSDDYGSPYSALGRTYDVEIFKTNSKTYAAVTSPNKNGVQFIDISAPGDPRAAGHRIHDAQLQKARTVSTITINNSHTGDELRTYAVVVGGNDYTEELHYPLPWVPGRHTVPFGYMTVIDATDPASPSVARSVSKGGNGALGNFDLAGAWGVDAYHLGAKAYAAVACGSYVWGSHNECNGVTVVEITDPEQPRQRGRLVERPAAPSAENHLLDSRGIDTFISGAQAYSASGSFADQGIQILRLSTVPDTTAPAIEKAALNPDRGILEITFNELVRASSANFDLAGLSVNSVAGASTMGALSGAELLTAADDTKMRISLSDSDKTEFAALFASTPYPGLDVAAGAFDDQDGNDVEATVDIEIEKLETSPVLRESSLDLGTGLVRLFFSEAVDVTPPSRVDLSKFEMYKLTDVNAKISLSSSSLVTGSDDRTLEIQLDEPTRLSVVELDAVPVIDLGAGAVRGSEGEHPSEASSGNVFTRVYEDRTRPELVSAVRDGGALVLAFTEPVKVAAADFDLDQIMFYRHGDRPGATYLAVGLSSATVATAADSETVRITLTTAQTNAMGSHKDLVLEMVLDGGLSAVEDVTGYGIGQVSEPLRNPDGTGPVLDSSEAPAFGSTGRTLTVVFSEGLWTAQTDPSKFHVRDGAGNANTAGQVTPTEAELEEGIDGSETVRFVLSEASAGAIEAMSDPHLYLDSGAVRGSDSDPSAAAQAGRDVSEPAQARPAIRSATALDLSTISVQFTKPVTSQAGSADMAQAWRLGGPDSEPGGIPLTFSAATSLSSATDTLALTINGRLISPASDVYIGYDDSRGVSISDAGDSSLTLSSATTVIGGASTFEATATASNMITVIFSDPVTEAGTSGPGGWSVSGPDAGALEVSERTDISASSRTLVLTLDGHLTSTNPEITLDYDEAAGEVRNEHFEISGSVRVSDGLAPRISSAEAVSFETISVSFSEPMALSDTHAHGWSVSGTDAADLSVDLSTATDGSDAVVLTLDGELADGAPDGVYLRYETSGQDVGSDALSGSGEISDLAGNALVAVSSITVSDGIAPQFSARITGDTQVTVDFTEPVSSADNSYLHWEFSHADGSAPHTAPLSASSLSSLASSMALQLNRALPLPTADLSIEYLGTGTVSDAAGNAVAAASADVSEDRRPFIESARATAANTVVVTFTKPVSSAAAPADLLGAWSISGGDAASPAILGLQSASSLQNPTRALTLTLDGDLPDTKPDGVSVAYDSTPDSGTAVAVSDAGGAALPDASVSVSDGIAPTFSASAPSRDKIRVVFSEPVSYTSTPAAATWILGGANLPPGVAVEQNPAVSGARTALLTLSGNLADPVGDVTLGYDDGPGNARDLSGNDLESGTAPVARDPAPTITSAQATKINEITVTFSKAVLTSDTEGRGWSVSGTDAIALHVEASSDVSAGSRTVVLTLDGDLADPAPDGVLLRYETDGRDISGDLGSGSGGIRDSAFNPLAARSSITVSDGIPPTISARTVHPQSVIYEFSEAVNRGSQPFTVIGYTGGNCGTTQTTNFEDGFRYVVLNASCPFSPSERGHFFLTLSDITDNGGNRLGTGRPALPVDDGAAPTITRTDATSLTTIRVTFNESVTTTDTAGKGWSISGPDSASRTVDSSTALDGNSVILTLSGPLADTKPDIRLRYETSGTDVAGDPGSGSGEITDQPYTSFVANGVTYQRSDVAQYLTFPEPPVNPLADAPNRIVSDRIAPTASFEATGDRTITVTFSEDVFVLTPHGKSDWAISGSDASGLAISSVSSLATPTDSMTIALDGDLPARLTDFKLAYTGTAITDGPSPMAAIPATDVPDERGPSIVSAVATGPDTILVTFSRAVSSSNTAPDLLSAWSLSGTDATVNNAPLTVSAATSLSLSTSTLGLTLSDNLPDTRPDLTLAYASAPDPGTTVSITDADSDALPDSSVDVGDGLAPAVSSAQYTGRGTVLVEFGEPVKLESGNAQSGWTVSGTDIGAATSASPPAGLATSSATSVTLTLNGQLADKTVLDFTLSYQNGNLVDESGNALQAYSEKPDDGFAPRVLSAEIFTSNQARITYSEPVTAILQYYQVSVDGQARTVPIIFGTGTDTHRVQFTGTAGTGATGFLTIDSRSVLDGSGNALGDSAALRQDLADGQSPTVASVTVTDRRTLSVAFSEAVQLSGAGAKPFGWALSGADAGSVQVDSVGGITQRASASTATLALDGDIADKTDPAITVAYSGGNIEDTAGNALAAYAATAAADGIAPSVSSAEYVSRDTVLLTFSEPVKLSSAGAPTGWTVSGADRGSATGAGAGQGDIAPLTDQVSASSATLTLNGNLADKTLLDFTLAYSGGNIVDAAGNALGQYSEKPSDGIRPEIESAVAGTLNSVTVVFSEPVLATSTAPSETWTLGGSGRPASVAVNDNPPIPTAATRTTLGLSGNLNDPLGTVTLAYDAGTGDVRDASGNGLASYTAAVMLDMPPSVSSARVAGPDSVVIQYSEPVTAAQSDYRSLAVGGQSRTVSGLLDGTTATHTITFRGGDPFGTDATGSVSINAPNITDATGNALGAGVIQQPLSDGQSPTVSAEYTARNSVALTFSEPVRLSSGSTPAGWTVSGTDKGAATAASSVSVITTSVTSTSATLTLNGQLADKTLLDFTLSYSGGNIEDDDGNALAAYSATPDDGIAPTVSSAKYTSRNTVDLEFSEPVRLSSGGAPTDWTVSGTDKGAATAASSVSVITTSVTSTSTTLTLDGDLADKTVLDFTLAYAASGNIEDQGGNALAAYSATPDDGIAPKITSAKVTGPNQITVAFSEYVFTLGSHYSSIVVDGAGRGISGSQTGRAVAAVISFDGAGAGTGAAGSLAINAGQVLDDANNALGTQAALPVTLTDGQAPTFTAEATGLDEITVTFSESLSISDETAKGWSVSGTDAAGRTVDSSTPVSNGDTVVLTLSSDLEDTRPDGVLLRYETSGTDVTGDPNSGSGAIADPASNKLAATSSVTVSDGIAPEVSSSKYTARNSVELTFSEPVRLSSAGAPTGWSASGADVVSSPTAGSAISVLTASATATSATLTLDNDLADKTSLDFTLSYDEAAGNIEDESDNALARYSEKPDDGLAPRITSAQATGLDQITVTFSENMNISDTTAQGWSVSGGDADGRTVDSSTAVSSGDTVVLTLGSDMEDTKPDGVLLQYKTSPGDVGSDPGSGSGAIADPSSNALAARQSIPVSDGIAPTATAEATALDRITVTFSEPVSVPANAQGWSVSGTDAAGLDVTASTSTSSGLSTVLTLSGDLADTNPDNAVLRYKTSAGNVGSDADSGSGAIGDPDSNALAARQNMPVSDGLAPTASFALTDDRAITVSFSEPVSSPDNDASHWSISGADASGLAVSSVSSLTSATGSMTVALDGDAPVPSTDLKLAYSAGGTISDGASLVLAAVPAAAVQDDRRPSIMSATAVDRETIVVEFTRGVLSTDSASDILSAWSVSGGDAASPSVLSVQSASSLAVRTSTLTLTLSSGLPDTKPDGVTLSFDSTAASVSDTESRNMADASVTVADGIAPEITSARVTGPSQITIEYGEDVLTSQSHYGQTVSVGGSDRSISGAQGGQTDTVTITFSGAVGTDATGSVSIDAARVADVAGNALGAGTLVQALADGQKPTVTSAKATKINEITVTFSEKVKATGTAGPAGWTISGGDSASRLVDSRSDISSDAGSATLVLRLNGGLEDTKPEGVKLAYAAASGTVADVAPAANELDSASDIDVSDGVKPEIESAKVTGPRQITIVYSETVTHNLAHYNNINVGGGRFASGFAGANTDTAVLSFAGSNTGTDATGTVQINFGAIRDGSNNALGSGHVTQTLTDGQAPTFTAKATELDKITVTFSENLSILDTTAQGWSVSGGDADGRTVDSSTAVSNGRSVVLTLGSDMEDTKPDGVVLRYKTSSGDVTGDANSGSGAIADPASNALEAKQSTAVSDGIKPEIESAKVTGPGQLTITYSEAVTASQSHYGSASVGGQTATISSISGQTTATHAISFTAPNPVGTGATGSVQIDSTQVKDGSNNALGTETALSQDLKDGQSPSVASATVADRRTIQVAFSESVRLSGAGTAPFGWAISGADANSAEVDSISDISESVSGTSATLTLDRDIADTTSPSVAVAYSGGNIEDTSDNDLAAYAAAAADDGIAPRIESAAVTSLTTVEVAFSEPVSVPANAQGWSISGADADGLDVTASTATSSGLSTVLTLSGALADTNPDNAVLRYKTSAGNVGSDASSGSGDIADLASNALEARASIPVSDGIAPTASFALTDDSTITVSFSEAVSSSSNAASNWAVSGTDAAGRAISSVSAIAGSVMTIQLGGAALPVPFTDLKLAYDGGGAITDGASLVLAAIPAAQVSDERRPAVTSAEATGPRTIVVTFSRDVSSSASAQDLLSAWSVSGGDADSPARLRVSGLSSLGSETRSMTVTLDGPLPDTKPDGVVLSFDATPSPGTTVAISDSSLRSLADASVSVSDGIAPEVESVEATGPRTIVATFSEDVRLSGAGTAPFGWAISGTDANSAEVDSIQGISESVSGTSATLNLDRDIAGTTSPSVTVAYSGGNIEDTSGNDLAAYAATAADDGIAPTVTSVTVTSRNTIAVAFSEPVRLDPAGAPTGWTLSGTDAASRAVSTIAFGSPASTATLTLDGDIADKTNPAVTVAYSGGNLEDTAGNDLAAYAAAAAADGIAPTFTARATALDKIAVTFSESVTATGTAGAGWSISGGDWNSRTVLSSSDISSGSTSLVLTLNGNLVDTKPDGVVLRYDPAAGDAQDAAGNEASGTAAVSDGIAPAIASAESRQANKITVTFSEPVSGTATAPGTTWTLSGAGAGGRTVTGYGAFSGTSVELTVSSAFPDPIGAVTLTYASPPGDIEDDADLALAGASEAVTQNLAPFISSAEATSLNAITVTFSEAVRGTATNPSDTWKLGGADAGTITVSRYPAPSGTSLVLGLSGNLPDTDPDLSLQYVRAAGDVEDLTGTPLESTVSPHVSVSDGLAPALSSAALNEGTGVLTLTFTETVDVSEMNESSISIREAGASSGGVALSASVRTTAADSATVSFTLSEQDRQAVIAMTTPQLDLGAGAASDSSSNSSSAASDRPIAATPDSVAPQLQSANLDEGAGTIALTFDEKMSTPTAAQAARVEIGTSGANIVFAEADIASAVLDSAGTTVTITVSEAKRQEIIAATPSDIDLLPGGLRDVSGTEASSSGTALTATPDTTRPALASAVLNTDDGVLVLSFSETMDASSFAGELAKVSVSESVQGTSVQLAGTARADGTNVIVTLEPAVLRSLLAVISAAPNAGAPGLLSLEVPGASPQFADTSGNAVASVSGNVLIEDGRPPSMVSASVTSSDTIVVRFSEDLADGTVQTSDFSVPGYDVSSVSELSGVVTITMSDPEAFAERDAPGVRTAGPVSDLFGNTLEPGARIQSVNAIMPVMISQFTVSHDGPAKAGDRIQITFRAQGVVAMDAALRVNGQAVGTASVPNGFDATYTVPAGAPQGPLKLHVEIVSGTGTPTEFSERDLTGPNAVVDTVPPSVASASIAGIDSVSLVYSEPVTASASDYTGIEADGSSPVPASGVLGSGSKSILVSWSGGGTTPSSVRLTAGAVTDAAGNAAAPSQITADRRQTEVTLEEPGIPLARGTTVETITAPSGIEPVVDVSSLTGTATDAAVIAAGGGSAVFESELRIVTRTFGLPDATFPAGTQAGGLGPLTSGGAAFGEAITIASSSSTAHLSEDQRELYPLLFDGITTTAQVGHPGRDIVFDRPVLLEFDMPLSNALVFSVGTLGVPLPIPACDPSWDTSALPVAQEVPEGWPPGTYDTNACVDEDSDSVWTGHFSLFGVSQPPPRGGSECDDCTPPTLGYDEYGARLVDGGFSYNGLASDVEYFFTPYPLIESEVGEENTVVLRIYENEGPQNVSHAALAFGLRSGEVISESRAVINYDISFDGTGEVSAIDPDGAIDLDALSAEHETVQCSPGSELECLQITMKHTFRAPLEFDIVGTDVWDTQRNSWQNYYNHGIKISGEPLDGRSGIEVDGMVLHPISPDSTNRDVMMSSDGHLFKMSPDGRYEPLSNQSRLYHDIDESMYLYSGVPMQGYDRSDPQFRDRLYEQVAEAQRVLDSMMPAPEAEGEVLAPASPDRQAEEERLRAAVAAEQERARLLFEVLFGYLEINGQD